MNAKETYKILRPLVGPWLRERGFKVEKSSYLTYIKTVGNQNCLICFQCHHNGWDRYSGSKFTVWFQLGPEREAIGHVKSRLTYLLSIHDLEFIRARQNRVITSIPQPPENYVADMIRAFERTFQNPKPMIDIYLSEWQTVDSPYACSDNIWFRYFSEDDVKSWALVMLRYIDSLLKKIDIPGKWIGLEGQAAE